LDATGNWKGFREDDTGSGAWDLVQSRTANTVNEITGITNTTGTAWATPAYDSNGNMTSLPKPTAPQSGFTGTYDAWNRLVKLADPTSGNTVQQNAYDGLRRRTTKQAYTAGTLSETRHYFYSSLWQVLEERVGTSANAERQFVWGLRYIDDLTLRDRDTNNDGTLDERMFALQDPSWNVVGLTDSSGNMQERYAYDAYGIPTVLTATFGSRSSSSYAWETRFAGYAYDTGIGLYVVRNRRLNSKVGTWEQRDLYGFGRDGASLYQYAHSRPSVFVDPSGRILIAIDGTASKAFRESGLSFDDSTGTWRSHVRNFYEDYVLRGGESKLYFDGPDSKLGFDTNDVYKAAKRQLDAALCKNPNEEVVLVGHSRGGLIANELARYLQGKDVKVKFLGLYDPVDMTVDLGSKETIPSNVESCGLAIRGDSSLLLRSRPYFNTIDAGPENLSKMKNCQVEKFESTTHAAMGGAPWTGDRPSSFSKEWDIRMCAQVGNWMRRQAEAAGIKLKPIKGLENLE
jgi:RHS repeat-associated protein